MKRRPKRLHIIQFIAGIGMFPLAVWLYLKGDYLGVAFAIVVGVLVVTFTSINLFVRQWP